MISTKYESWRYEREWRLLCELSTSENEGGLYFVRFAKDLKLVEVILGPLCQLSLKRIRGLVDDRHKGAMTYKARLAYRSFRIIAASSKPTKRSLMNALQDWPDGGEVRCWPKLTA